MKNLSIILVFLLTCHRSYSQEKLIPLSGQIKEAKSGESLPFATVYAKEAGKGVATNEYGYFSIFLPKRENTLTISFVGFAPKEIVINLSKETFLSITLDENESNLDEVIITNQKLHQESQLEVQKISMKQLESMPLVFGEQDLVKAVQFLPGIKTVGEGTSAIFVRGGNDDQNLILLDEMPLYNVGHMLGLVSVFNPDAIKSINLYKSIAPASFGGRVSAVMDVRQNEGDDNKTVASGGLNVFGMRGGLQGPIKKESNASYLVAFRKSLVDLFVKPENEFVPGYADFNGKGTLPIDDTRQFQIGTYVSRDFVQSEEGFENKWGNTGLNIKYQQLISSRLFSSYSIIVSDYQNELIAKDSLRNMNWKTGVQDYILKADYEWNVNPRFNVEFGASSILHHFTPGKSSNQSESVADKKALESGVYLEGEWQMSKQLQFSIGTRWSTFTNMGNDVWFDPNTREAIVNRKGIYHFDQHLEPRMQLLWDLSFANFALGYARNTQYAMVLKNTQLAYTSLESWFPASPNIKPMLGDSYTAGVNTHSFHGIELSIAAYYRYVRNQSDFINHARLIENPKVALDVRQGIGRAWGVETMISKNKGSFTYNLSYVWSRSLNEIDAIHQQAYSTRSDIPHDVKLNASYRTQGRWQFNAFWTYSTGRPFTAPTAWVSVEGRGIPIYSERNSSRFPDYHRLDVSVVLHPKESEERFQGTWTFGIYNLYAHTNPLSYNFSFSPNSLYSNLSITQYNFIRFFPNLSYAFKF